MPTQIKPGTRVRIEPIEDTDETGSVYTHEGLGTSIESSPSGLWFIVHTDPRPGHPSGTVCDAHWSELTPVDAEEMPTRVTRNLPVDAMFSVADPAGEMSSAGENQKLKNERSIPPAPDEAPPTPRLDTPGGLLLRWEADGLADPTCPSCAPVYDAVCRGLYPYTVMGPRHRASKACESGKRAHCSCGACF